MPLWSSPRDYWPGRGGLARSSTSKSTATRQRPLSLFCSPRPTAAAWRLGSSSPTSRRRQDPPGLLGRGGLSARGRELGQRSSPESGARGQLWEPGLCRLPSPAAPGAGLGLHSLGMGLAATVRSAPARWRRRPPIGHEGARPTRTTAGPSRRVGLGPGTTPRSSGVAAGRWGGRWLRLVGGTDKAQWMLLLLAQLRIRLHWSQMNGATGAERETPVTFHSGPATFARSSAAQQACREAVRRPCLGCQPARRQGGHLRRLDQGSSHRNGTLSPANAGHADRKESGIKGPYRREECGARCMSSRSVAWCSAAAQPRNNHG